MHPITGSARFLFVWALLGLGLAAAGDRPGVAAAGGAGVRRETPEGNASGLLTDACTGRGWSTAVAVVCPAPTAGLRPPGGVVPLMQ